MPLTPEAQRTFRSLSSTFTHIWLLTFFHASFGYQRFTSNTVPFVSRTLAFIPIPWLDVKKPPSQPSQVPAVEMLIGVNDQTVVDAIRAVDDSPLATLELVFAEDPDVVQDLTKDVTFEEVEFGVLMMRVYAGHFRIFQTLWPKRAYTPDVAPGAFV